MKINSSTIEMSSKHSLKESSSKQQSLKVWIGNMSISSNDISKNFVTKDKVTLSKEGKELLRKLNSEKTQPAQSTQDTELSLSDEDKNKIRLLEQLIEQITGKKIKIVTLEPHKTKTNSLKIDDINLKAQQPQGQQQSVGWGINFQSNEVYSEHEQTSFSAKGSVTTSSGKQIKFNLNLELSHEFTSTTDISFKAGDALIDPLAINFDSATAHLSDRKMSFDLNSDGKNEQISFLVSGSGFLAIDNNGDGKVNNGSELFGTKTGNGFGELATFDQDSNNWIDENDPIFENLKIWIVDENSNESLVAIGEKGIGAIYLGNVNTAFGVKNSQNELLGQLKTSGVFLKENGEAGTVQQVDL